MKHKNLSRALALGLAAAQFAPLSAVVMNVSAFADDAAVSDKVFADNVKISVLKAGGGVAGEAQYFPATNTIEYKLDSGVTGDETSNTGGAGHGDPQYNAVALKIETTDAKKIAFANYGFDISVGDSSDGSYKNCDNVKDGYLLFWLDVKENSSHNIEFRKYSKDVQIYCTKDYDAYFKDGDGNQLTNNGKGDNNEYKGSNQAFVNNSDSATAKQTITFKKVSEFTTESEETAVTYTAVSKEFPAGFADTEKGVSAKKVTDNISSVAVDNDTVTVTFSKTKAEIQAIVKGDDKLTNGAGSNDGVDPVYLNITTDIATTVDASKITWVSGYGWDDENHKDYNFANGHIMLWLKAVLTNEDTSVIKYKVNDGDEQTLNIKYVYAAETTPETKEYTLKITEGTGYTVEVYKAKEDGTAGDEVAADSKVTKGQKLFVNVKAADGKVIKSAKLGDKPFTVNGDGVYVLQYTVPQLAEDVTDVTIAPVVELDEVKEANVTFTKPTGGAIAVSKTGADGKDEALTSPAKVKTGDTLKIKATPDSGYKFTSWNVTGADVADKTKAETTIVVTGTEVKIAAALNKTSSTGGSSSGGSSSSGGNGYSGSSSSTSSTTTTTTAPTTPTVDGKSVTTSQLNNSIKSSTATTVKVDVSSTKSTTSTEVKTSVAASTTKAVTETVNAGAANKKVELTVSDSVTLTVDKSSAKTVDSNKSIVITEQRKPETPAKKADNTDVRGTAAKSFEASNVGNMQATVNVGSAKNGEFANVYRLNPVTKKPEFVGTAKVVNGKATVPLNGDGKYYVMTGKYSDLKGDTDNDGMMNAKDAVAILKEIANVAKAPNNDKSIADLNGDGKVNVKDAVVLLKLIAGVKP